MVSGEFNAEAGRRRGFLGQDDMISMIVRGEFRAEGAEIAEVGREDFCPRISANESCFVFF